MTSIPADPRRVAVLGTGLIGTSVAMAAIRAGCEVVGWDADAAAGEAGGARGGFAVASTPAEALQDADLVVVAAPIEAIGELVAAATRASPRAIVTDAGSVKSRVVEDAAAAGADLARFVPGHPMGGSERSGAEHASASILDGAVWVLAPTAETDPQAVRSLTSWVQRVGARPITLDPRRHDRLVAFVSHLPQVASTSLMGLAAAEEAGEPDLLLLAASGFRDTTRLAASDPRLWSEILLANREAVAEALDRYRERLAALRDEILEGDAGDVQRVFEDAKAARLRLAAKPRIRAGVALLLIDLPDRPGALAHLAGSLADASVNIEDLQIVHSPDGSRGTVHLTVAGDAGNDAERVLSDGGYDPTRLV